MDKSRIYMYAGFYYIINLMKAPFVKYVFLALGIFLFLVIILQIINYNRVALGLKVANLNIGGKTANQAEASLLQYFSKLQNQEMVLKYGNKEYPAQFKELGVILNPVESSNLAISIGHKNNFFLGLVEQIKAFLGNCDLEPILAFDESRFNNFIAENLSDIEKPVQNASLIFNPDTNDFDLVPSQKGQIIDREKFKKDLKKIGQFSSISLTLTETKPEITNEKTDEAKNSALNILKNAPYNLTYNPHNPTGEENSWLIDKETLVSWLEFIPAEKILTVSLNQDKVKDYLSKIASSIDQEPINAQLKIQEGKANVFSLAKNGIKLDINKNAKKVTKSILAGATEKITLETEEIRPEITANEDINNFGLVSLLGKGESDFAGSPANRIHNIKTGASKMNGLLLKPGQEFSFNDLLGEVGPEQGYLAELVIKKNKTTPEFGGGLCQVSTTLFRATVNSGLKITERYAHAFAVKYYNPQGFDATIYPPHPDLKFINDTPNYLLIQAKIKGTKLTFEFYGTDDGREVKVKGPVQYDKQPDGSLKATLTQEIWRNGQLERQSIFKSNYKSPDLYPIERNPLE